MKRVHGFTFVELIITFAVLALLAAIAVPSYINYSRRAYYNDLIQATAPYKVGVTQCYQNLSSLTNCNGGTNHIPANIKAPTGPIASLSVIAGVITVAPVEQNGIRPSDTYILTPKIINNVLTWVVTGGSVKDGYT